jgi:hypothetical protein
MSNNETPKLPEQGDLIEYIEQNENIYKEVDKDVYYIKEFKKRGKEIVCTEKLKVVLQEGDVYFAMLENDVVESRMGIRPSEVNKSILRMAYKKAKKAFDLIKSGAIQI